VTPLEIVFIPDDSGSNPYALRMQELLSSFGLLQTLRPKSRMLRLLRGDFRRVDIVFVNWMENELICRQSGRLSVRGALKLLYRTAMIKLLARRTAFVRHNLYPHITKPESARFARQLVDRYESLFDVVFVHSGVNEAMRNGTRERHYLPHPLYRSPSGSSDQPRPHDFPDRYFLVFGRILPYKNIESLMSAFPEDETLVVCGEASDPDYSAKLAGIARANVLYRPGYISEESARAIVTAASAVVIAHAEPNVIVSGTFFYAVSLQRHVFAVRTPFLEWLAPRVGQDVLSLARDIPDLCELIKKTVCRPISASSQQVLEHEFGDDAVRSALAVAFKSPGR
jgi:glycosyltransferase involved in cell wall biosynthesis